MKSIKKRSNPDFRFLELNQTLPTEINSICEHNLFQELLKKMIKANSKILPGKMKDHGLLLKFFNLFLNPTTLEFKLKVVFNLLFDDIDFYYRTKNGDETFSFKTLSNLPNFIRLHSANPKIIDELISEIFCIENLYDIKKRGWKRKYLILYSCINVDENSKKNKFIFRKTIFH